MRRKPKQKSIMAHLFHEDEIKYLVRRLTDEFLGGVGPAEPDIPIGAHYQPTKLEGLIAARALREMKVGDSREVMNKLRLRPFISASEKLKMKIAFRRLDRGEYRFWKLSDPPAVNAGLKKALAAQREKRRKLKKAAKAVEPVIVPKQPLPPKKGTTSKVARVGVDGILDDIAEFQKNRPKKKS